MSHHGGHAYPSDFTSPTGKPSSAYVTYGEVPPGPAEGSSSEGVVLPPVLPPDLDALVEARVRRHVGALREEVQGLLASSARLHHAPAGAGAAEEPAGAEAVAHDAAIAHQARTQLHF